MPLAGPHRRRTSTTSIVTKLITVPVALACAAALCVALAAGTTAPVASASSRHAAFGTYVSATTPPSALKAALGGTVRYAMDFQSGTSWSTITSSSWPYPRWKGKGYDMIWGIPMLPGNYSPSTNMADTTGSCYGLEQEAGGAFNADWTKVAKALVQDGFNSSVVRLGWEFNGGWFPWAANGCAADFVAAYQQIVTTMRAVKGSKFSFEWNPTAGDLSVGNLADYYPGNSFVNYVGLDIYDVAWANYPGAQNEFDTIKTESYGLDWLSLFAAEQGKQIVLPEWGLGWGVCDGGLPVSGPGNETCGGDDPTFVNDMASWITNHDVFEATFWDYGSSSLQGCPDSCTAIGKADGDVNPIPSGNIKSFKSVVADFGSGSGSGTGPTTTTTTSGSTTTTTNPPPGPSVVWIAPNGGIPGGTVYVYGHGFSRATRITFGSNAGTIVSVSPYQIVATVPPGTPQSIVDVRVTGPGGTSPSVDVDQFHYGPWVKWIAPTIGNHGGGTTVTIRGAGYTGATAVDFGGAPATIDKIYDRGKRIRVTAPPGSAGAVNVTVTVGGRTTAITAADQFTYQ